jgi:hypothetical protein
VESKKKKKKDTEGRANVRNFNKKQGRWDSKHSEQADA